MNVAITGATGFLGLHLVRELLERQQNLIVLAHAGSACALTRISRFFAHTGASEAFLAELPTRLRVVLTDVSKPRLGLGEQEFQELADELEVIWHSAGNIALDDDLEALRRVNVDGTRQVLALAAAGRREPRVLHISTAFVAGLRRQGVALETELSDAHGFENNYERSKYEAETLVHDWAARHGRPAVILRPSVLVTDLPPNPVIPPHPLQFLSGMLASATRALGLDRFQGAEPPVVRVVANRDGFLNFLPVEQAAAAMLRLAEQPGSGGVDTYHVVHHRDLPIPDLIRVIGALAPVRLELVPTVPDNPSVLEKGLSEFPSFSPYLNHSRVFDDRQARAVLGPEPLGPTLDVDYLLAGVLTGVGSPA